MVRNEWNVFQKKMFAFLVATFLKSSKMVETGEINIDDILLNKIFHVMYIKQVLGDYFTLLFSYQILEIQCVFMAYHILDGGFSLKILDLYFSLQFKK